MSDTVSRDITPMLSSASMFDRLTARFSLLGGCMLGGGNAGPDQCPMSREVGSPTECACRKRTRHALEVLENPTQAMLSAAYDCDLGPIVVWDLMIGAAMKETEA